MKIYHQQAGHGRQLFFDEVEAIDPSNLMAMAL
jgi:hypothetical protein